MMATKATMATIAIDFDNARAVSALERLSRVMSNPAPALKAIGDQLIESTRQRIAAGGPGPHGEPWDRNSPVTMSLAAAHGKKPAGNRPLIDSGLLMDTLSYAVRGDTLYVGTNRFADDWQGGAAVLQFGTDRAGRGHKIHIPPRPFLGVSDDDAREIEVTVADVLRGLTEG